MPSFWCTHIWKACVFKVWLLQLSQVLMPYYKLLSYESTDPSYHNGYSVVTFFAHASRVISVKFTCELRRQSTATVLGPTLSLCLRRAS